MLPYGQQRARDLFSERPMDLQGCQLLLEAQAVVLKGLRRVLKPAREKRGGGEQPVRRTEFKGDM